MSFGDRLPPELDATADALSVAWNAIARGAPVGSEAEAGSPFAPTLRRLHAIDDAPALTLEQRARIWRDLMSSQATRPALVVLTPVPLAPAIWPAADESAGDRPVVRPRWSTNFLATAAVLALILGTVLLTVGLWQPNRWLHTGNPPGVLADEIVFRQRLDDIPGGATQATVHHDLLPPGADWKQGTPSSSGLGPMVYRVETGAIALQADGAFQVTRRGASSASSIPAGTRIELGAGDVAFLPSGVASSWRNQGTATATLVDAGLTDGVASRQAPSLQTAAIAQPISQPLAAPAELSLRRVTLAPGGALAGAATGGLRVVGVDGGTAEIGWANKAVPDAIVGTRRLGAGAWTDLDNGSMQAATLRNPGNSTLTLLILSVTPLSPGPDATPAAAGAESLLAGRFDDIPQDASWIGVERYTAPPGAAWTQGAASMSGVGPMLYRIERGAVSVQADGPFEVTRAGESRPTAVGSGSKTTLASGDVAFMPSGVVTQWRNDGKEPADILDGGVTTVGAADLSMLKPFTQPINDWGVAPPKAPVDFTLQRVTVAPGATLKSAPAGGVKLLAVESGTVDIVWSQPIAEALQGPSSASATDAANAPNQLTANHWVDTAQHRQYASALRNAGSEPLVMLLLTIAPAGADPAAPAAPGLSS